MKGDKMEFIWTDSTQATYTEKSVWQVLKSAFPTDEGLCYYRYPVFSADQSQHEPNFLILHRKWGLYVIECRDFSIDNIERIDKPLWFMRNWHNSIENPAMLAEDQLMPILHKFESESELRRDRESVIKGHTFIILPSIYRAQWTERHFNTLTTSLSIIFADDLEPGTLRACLEHVPTKEKQEPITDEQWLRAISILRGSPILRRETRQEFIRPETKAAFLRQVEQQMRSIDQEQHKVAIQIPEGPQRIRGLAGSGKTVVMCMKIAQMHLNHPEWDIAYTFYTRSLAAQIRTLITRFYGYWNTNHESSEVNWNKLHILHGWGGEIPGLYSSVAHAMRRKPRTYSEAQNNFPFSREHSELLGSCCKELLDAGEGTPSLFDAIIVDEAQDFHFDYYKLCYKVLREPKRLIWAYDEVQSLESLSIPTTIDIFGTHADGAPIVDLEGTYPGEIEKDMILHRCYRTPRPVLVAAHIFGMGLLRPQGAVQFIPTSGGWEDIGYEVVSGNFTPGQKVTIRRPEANSPHPLEKFAGYKELISMSVFDKRDLELDWIAQQIKSNIEVDGLKPEEIVVISLDGRKIASNFFYLEQKLNDLGIKTHSMGIPANAGIFQKPGKVTLTGIFRAKGNEASIVYVMNFDQVENNRKIIVQNRNQAFTAMTRTRGWCILTGLGEKARSLFTEIDTILSQGPEQITFTVPDPKTIQRNLDSLEYEKRRNRIKKAKDLTIQLERVLAELDDDSIRSQILERLKRSDLEDK
jgi:superfamily I DNA and RNA helicase